MLLKYHALNAQGHYIKGYIWAKEEMVAMSQLQKLPLELIKVRHVLGVKRFLSTPELIDLLFYFTWMLEAGVPLRQAMEELTLTLKMPKLIGVIHKLITYLDQGFLLSEAMALLPNVFPPQLIYYVIVGEKSGSLIEQFSLLTIALKEELKWRNKLSTSLAYPLLTLAVALGAFFYLMIEIVPTLAELSSTQEAPTLGWGAVLSYWLHSYGIEVMVGVGSVGILLLIGAKIFPSWRAKKDAYLLSLPLIGIVIRDIALIRMIEMIAHLYAAGSTLLEALLTVEDLLENEVIRQQLKAVSQALEQGNSLTVSFSQQPIFPPILIRALSLAEQSGHVAISLAHSGQFFRAQILLRLKKIQTLLGPMCLLIVGGILLATVTLIFAPLFETIGHVP